LDCLGTEYSAIGFIDDSPDKWGSTFFGLDVFSRDVLQRDPEAQVLAVPGSPTSFRQRQHAVQSLGVSASRLARVVHPSARVSPLATLGVNVLVMAGVVITSNAHIGDHVCILPNSVIHHDAFVGDWSLIGSNVTIAGHAVVGRNCYVGSGTSVINNVRIGDRSLVGIGTNVIREVPDDATIAGNPARILSMSA
jgi:sugar O-acyltransferase (sialic acid O-acetyltransferase NeuD family)